MLAFKIAERFIESGVSRHLFIDECGDAVEDQRLNVAVSVDFWQRNSEAPVDLKKLLLASNDVFFHDVIGILKNVDSENATVLPNVFLPKTVDRDELEF